MSEPIIIETPAPPTRERLVLVPVDACNEVREDDPRVKLGAKVGLTVFACHARDATPADLARGGYVLRTVEETATLDRGIGRLYDERDKAKARAEKAEGLLTQRETELRLAREDGDERSRDLRQAYERAVAAAEKAERERDDVSRDRHALATEAAVVRDILQDIESDDDLRETAKRTKAALVRIAAERDTLRAELASLNAPGEGEPTYEALGEHYRNAWDASKAMLEMGRRHDAYAALYRLGVAHKRARQQPAPTFVQATGTHTFGGRPRAGQGLPPDAQPEAQDRATDEELADLYRKAYETHVGRTIDVSHDDCRRAAVAAVAARVWQERCLVAQAVAMRVSLEIGPHSKGVDIHVSRPRENADGGEFFEGELVEAGRDDVPPSEASATLARLLGEVSRG